MRRSGGGLPGLRVDRHDLRMAKFDSRRIPEKARAKASVD